MKRIILVALAVGMFIISISLNNASFAEQEVIPTPTDGCGEAAGIQEGATYVDVCATWQASTREVTPTPTPTTKPTLLTASSIEDELVVFLDSDGDGCSDRVELSGDNGHSRLRDPANPWDFLNFIDRESDSYKGVTIHRIDMLDIQQVAFRFGAQKGDLLYDSFYDRVDANNPGVLGTGDGVIDEHDLDAARSQYGEECVDPLSVPLKEFMDSCGGVVLELDKIDGSSSGCFAIRNEDGQIVDVQYVSFGQVGGAAAICTTCVLPPVEPGTWYTSNDMARWRILWPLVEEVCVPTTRWCADLSPIEVTLLSYEMKCTWNWFDGPSGHPYDGATTDHDCSDTSFSSVAVYALEGEQLLDPLPITGTFTVRGRANGRIGVFSISGVALRHFTVQLRCDMGPWGLSYCWSEG